MISREQRTPLSEWWWTVDRLLLAAMVLLMLTGVVLSLAASPSVATRIGLDPFHFFHRHVMFLLPSIMVMVGVSFLSPRQIRRSASCWRHGCSRNPRASRRCPPPRWRSRCC